MTVKANVKVKVKILTYPAGGSVVQSYLEKHATVLKLKGTQINTRKTNKQTKET